MNDFAQTEVPVSVDSGTIPEATPNQAVTPEAPVHAEPKTEAPVKVSAREAIENAAKKVDAAEAKAKTPEPVAKPRAEDGKFAAKEPAKEVAAQPMQQTAAQEPLQQVAKPEIAASKYEAPARFSEAAKTEWQRAPESVQAEVARVLKENEDGINKYKASHERYESLKQFDEIAKGNGRDLKDSLAQIVDIERTMTHNPIEGLKKVAAHFDLNLQAMAAHILGQNPNQHVAEAHQQIRTLQQENAMLKQQLEAPNAVQSFRSEVGQELFDSLADDIAELLESGVAHDLKSAFTMAKMIARRNGSNPSGQGAQTAATPAAQTGAPVTAQTSTAAERQPNPAANKSVTGAPGSTPTTQQAKPSGRSIQDSINHARQTIGA